MNVSKIKNFILKNKFAVSLILISVIVCSANYQPGTILSGWDTLHPEFNFPQYFRRIFFGVWQEHQGLGTLATQAHASEIARMFIYYPLSFVLPDSLLRYSYFFLTIILGPLGTYFFIKQKVLRGNNLKTETSAFLGGLFYLLNLGTLQHFYVPFEMFAIHFASLPWLLFFAIDYFENKSIKSLLIFSLAAFLSAPMAHTSTLWFAFLGALSLFLFSYCLLRKDFKNDIKKLFVVMGIFLLINAFWLLPNLYFLINEGDIVSNSKIHSLFSEEAFAQNQSFGTLPDILIFKNFLFNWGEYVRDNKFDFLLNEWIVHLRNPLVLALGYAFSVIATIGFIYSVFKKNLIAASLVGVLLVSIFFWFNSNPPFGFIYSFLRDNIPLFKEAFRFPFTKFSILLVFCASVYFSFGITFIINLLSRSKENKIISYYVFFTILIGIIYYALPAFKGNFISPSMKVKIPSYYYQMFNWFDNEPRGRIANLPINSFWGWTYYDWYYQGAGFLWFGIPQPLLDREFDRWGPTNEQYYREMSQAVYTKDQDLLETVIDKYNISYLLVDRSIIAPGPGSDFKTLFVHEIQDMLNKSSLVKGEKDFQSISVYKKTDRTPPIYTLTNAETISPISKVFYEDFAFEKYGDYISADKGGINYPFREIINNQNHLLNDPQFTQNGLLFKLAKTDNLELPKIESLENIQPADLFIVKGENQIKVLFYLKHPSLGVSEKPLEVTLPVTQNDLILSINHKYNFRVGDLEKDIPFLLGQINLYTNKNNPITVYPSSENEIVEPEVLGLDYALFPCGNYDKTPVFGIDPINRNSFSFFSKHAQACIRFPIKTLIDQDKFQDSRETLVSIKYNFDGDFQSNLCLSLKDNPNCIYYFLKNLESNRSINRGLSQYFSLSTEDLSNLEVKIFLDSTDLKTSKRVRYQDITLGFTTPLLETNLSGKAVKNGLTENSSIDSISEVLISFSGNRDLSQDITKLPKTGGDCPTINPRGPAPSSKEVVKDESSSYIRYISDDGSFCDHFSYQGLDPNQAYLIAISSRNLKGLPIRLCVANLVSKRCDIYTHLPKNKNFKTDIYLLPPMNEGDGFDINVNNFAIERIPSTNDLASINVVPIPYNWLFQIEEGSPHGKSKRIPVASISHPNPSLYTVSGLDKSSNQTLVLTQSFDKGWKAYEIGSINLITEIFPFIFGTALKDHVIINSWANGWVLNGQPSMVNRQFVIVYLPQYLEYLGIILTTGVLISLILALKRKQKRS